MLGSTAGTVSKGAPSDESRGRVPTQARQHPPGRLVRAVPRPDSRRKGRPGQAPPVRAGRHRQGDRRRRVRRGPRRVRLPGRGARELRGGRTGRAGRHPVRPRRLRGLPRSPGRVQPVRPPRHAGHDHRRPVLRARHQPRARVPDRALRRGRAVPDQHPARPARRCRAARADQRDRKGRHPGLRGPAPAQGLGAPAGRGPRRRDHRAPRRHGPAESRAGGPVLRPGRAAVPESRPPASRRCCSMGPGTCWGRTA